MTGDADLVARLERFHEDVVTAFALSRAAFKHPFFAGQRLRRLVREAIERFDAPVTGGVAPTGFRSLREEIDTLRRALRSEMATVNRHAEFYPHLMGHNGCSRPNGCWVEQAANGIDPVIRGPAEAP